MMVVKFGSSPLPLIFRFHVSFQWVYLCSGQLFSFFSIDVAGVWNLHPFGPNVAGFGWRSAWKKITVPKNGAGSLFVHIRHIIPQQKWSEFFSIVGGWYHHSGTKISASVQFETTSPKFRHKNIPISLKPPPIVVDPLHQYLLRS